MMSPRNPSKLRGRPSLPSALRGLSIGKLCKLPGMETSIQIQLMDVAVVNLDLAVRAFGEGRVVGDDDDRAALGPEVGE